MKGSFFFVPARSITAAQAAEFVGAELLRAEQGEVVIRSVASLGDGGRDDLVFAEGRQSAASMGEIAAAALLCSRDVAAFVAPNVAVLVTKTPQRAFAAIARLLYPDASSPVAMMEGSGIAATAVVHPSAVLEEGTVVEAGAVIGPGVEIGAGTIIAPNAVIGRNCRIGRNGFVGPGASVQNALIGNRVVIHGGAHIGKDGFGYVPGPKGPEKMPQLGRVIIQDGVEIGASSTIDRGALADTVIGENTKIDNLVQIAHNVRIGRNCLIASHSGISGSVTIGDNCMLGGRAGVVDHITIGSNVQLAAACGVTVDVPSNSTWGGFPARPLRDWLRSMAALRRLGADPKRRSDD